MSCARLTESTGLWKVICSIDVKYVLEKGG